MLKCDLRIIFHSFAKKICVVALFRRDDRQVGFEKQPCLEEKIEFDKQLALFDARLQDVNKNWVLIWNVCC